MNDQAEFKTVTSSEAKEVKVSRDGSAEAESSPSSTKEMGELPVDARVTVRCPANETLTYWNLEVNNRTTFLDRAHSVSGDRSALRQSRRQGLQPYPLVVCGWRAGGAGGARMSVGAWGGREYDTPEALAL